MSSNTKLQRWKRLNDILEVPMIILGFAWLILIIIDLAKGLSPFWQKVNMAIWVVFVVEFFTSLILSPNKKRFLKKNILVFISLIVPAFRILRVFRAMRALRVIKAVGPVHRGTKRLLTTLERGGFVYMIILSLVVLIFGAAGMYAFERGTNPKFNSFYDSLWWTAMMLLTVGNDFWPKSAEGRILCCGIALFGFAGLGYVAAMATTFFMGQNPNNPGHKHNELPELRREIAELKELLRQHMDNRK